MAHIANCMRRTLDKTDSVYIMEETLTISPTVSWLPAPNRMSSSTSKTADKRYKDCAVSKREC